MNAEMIMGLILVAGPTIRAAEEQIQRLIALVAKARAGNTITQEEQDTLMQMVESFRHVAETDTYDPHWYAKGTPQNPDPKLN